LSLPLGGAIWTRREAVAGASLVSGLSNHGLFAAHESHFDPEAHSDAD